MSNKFTSFGDMYISTWTPLISFTFAKVVREENECFPAPVFCDRGNVPKPTRITKDMFNRPVYGFHYRHYFVFISSLMEFLHPDHRSEDIYLSLEDNHLYTDWKYIENYPFATKVIPISSKSKVEHWVGFMLPIEYTETSNPHYPATHRIGKYHEFHFIEYLMNRIDKVNRILGK